jgi:Tfp pilus assembly protein PilX
MENAYACGYAEEYTMKVREREMKNIVPVQKLEKQVVGIFCSPRRPHVSQRGIALVMALIITLVIFMMVATTLYMVTQGTRGSGQGTVYHTACEAADGSVLIVAEAIERKIAENTVPLPPNLGLLFTPGPAPGPLFDPCLQNAVNEGLDLIPGQATCNATLVLAGLTGSYAAVVTAQRLFPKQIPGSATSYTRGPGMSDYSKAIIFRITTNVSGPKNATCENMAVYRHVI